MTRLAVVVAVATLAGPAYADGQSTLDPAAAGQLRWVRGVVISLSPDTAVLQLRSENITVALDPSMAPSLRLNGLAEVHYTEKNDIRHAVLAFTDAAAGQQQLSKRPGRSYRGVITRVKRGAVNLQVANKSRELGLEKRTRLIDAQGSEIALGSKAILPLLATGQPVLVKYEDDSTLIAVGDVSFLDSSEDAVEIRRLGTR